jgi:hypothetical protein
MCAAADWPDSFEDGQAIWPKKKDSRMTDLPKQELLIKLLRMTESDNDGEALTALRKANRFMKDAGWDWEKLVNSKIKIIEDPFKNLGTPPGGTKMGAPGFARPSQPTAAPRPQAPPRPTPTPPPPPPQPAARKASWPLGIDPNRFSGWCYCCGFEVLANVGVIFKPYQYNSQAPNDWKVACLSCNGTKSTPGATVNAYSANRRRGMTAKGKPKPAVSDLS